MIVLSGFSIKDKNRIDGDIEIEVIGLRPGEKLYEELLVGNDAEIIHVRILRAREKYGMGVVERAAFRFEVSIEFFYSRFIE